MSLIVDFINECGVFFVLTTSNDSPCGRPFGVIMQYQGDLYISTGSNKSVYKQMKANNKVQLLAHKSNTRDWLRVNTIAEECYNRVVKEKMLKDFPQLSKHFSSADDVSFTVFKLTILDYKFYD